MGFPGVRLRGSTVKIAQQNCREHFRAIEKLCDLFAPDMVFPLMDLSVEANALGFYTVFPVDDTPTVVKPDFTSEIIDRINHIDISFDARIMGYVETVRLMAVGLPETVIRGAYVTGPFTLAALMMGAENAAMATLTDMEQMHSLCGFTMEVTRKYARNMIAAGAQVICLLEPSAVILGPDQFRDFSVMYAKRIIEECEISGVASIYHTCGNTVPLIDEMVASGVTALSLDSIDMGIDIAAAAERVGGRSFVMGNMSPTQTLLRGTVDQVRDEVTKLLRSVDEYPGFVLSTGCDLPFETPSENIKAFMDTARYYRRDRISER